MDEKYIEQVNKYASNISELSRMIYDLEKSQSIVCLLNTVTCRTSLFNNELTEELTNIALIRLKNYRKGQIKALKEL